MASSVDVGLTRADRVSPVAVELCEADAVTGADGDAALVSESALDTDESCDTLADPLLLGLPDTREVTDDETETHRDTTEDGVTEDDAEFFVDNVCVRVIRAETDVVAHPLKV